MIPRVNMFCVTANPTHSCAPNHVRRTPSTCTADNVMGQSISNRILLLAGVARGTCRVRGLLHSDDTQVMMGALQQLGASFDWEDGGATLVVHGTGGRFRRPTEALYLSNAGTAARFLTTLVTLVGTGGGDARTAEEKVSATDADAPPRTVLTGCLLYTSPSPRDGLLSRMPSSA